MVGALVQPSPDSDELLGGVNPVPLLSWSNIPLVLLKSVALAVPRRTERRAPASRAGQRSSVR